MDRAGRFLQVWIVALALLLSGCIAPGARQSSSAMRRANELDAGRAISNAAVRSETWPQSDWWKMYGDPQLDALLERALADNPRLAIAVDRIAEAQALAGHARASTLPTLRAEASSIHTHFSENEIFPPPLGGGDFWDNSAQLMLSYDLDVWGRDEKNLAAALAAVQVSRYDAQTARLILAGTIVRNYAALALQFELKDSGLAILDDRQRTLAIIQRRIAAGIGTELEAQEIITEIAAEHAELEQIDMRIALLRHTLGALTGAGPGAGDALQRPRLQLDRMVELPSSIPADLLGRRPDVVAELWRVERASDNIDVAKAAFYPNINLRAFAGLVSFGFSKFFDASSESTGVGPAISLPIFDGGNLRSGLRARTAEYDAAVHAYNATLVDALTDIANQLTTLEALQRVERERNAALNAATRAHQLALQAFAAGLTDSLNVLHTQTALSMQRSLLADVHFQQLASWAALNQALGGGLSPASAETMPVASADHF